MRSSPDSIPARRVRRRVVWVNTGAPTSGAFAYGARVRDALREHHDVVLEDLWAGLDRHPRVRPLALFKRLLTLQSRVRGDVIIRDTFEGSLLPFDPRFRHLVVIHHVDNSCLDPVRRLVFGVINPIGKRNTRAADAVVTVAECWGVWFRAQSFKNVFTIHNALDRAEFAISDGETQGFRREHRLEDRPVVYIGNCQRAKGVVETYQTLRDLPVHLVTSGARTVEIGARNFDVPRREYLKLLKAATVTVTMSRMIEGWCLSAHESLMVGTPVVGSGLGGMRELLEGGDQIICSDPTSLRRVVQHILKSPQQRDALASKGQAFAASFTLTELGRKWLELVDSLF